MARVRQVVHAGKAWVCMGNALSYNTGTNTKPAWKVTSIPGAARPVATAATGPSNLDLWCEPKGICAQRINKSDYIVQVKANVRFGAGGDTYGSHDEIWRQAFNGPWARWRLTLKWDSGSATDPGSYVAREMQVRKGKDYQFCVAKTFHPAAVSKLKRWATIPTKPRKYRSCSKKVTAEGHTWYDELEGYFYARGHGFRPPVLHTGHWYSEAMHDGTIRLSYTHVWPYDNPND